MYRVRRSTTSGDTGEVGFDEYKGRPAWTYSWSLGERLTGLVLLAPTSYLRMYVYKSAGPQVAHTTPIPVLQVSTNTLVTSSQL